MALTELFPAVRTTRTTSFIIGISLILFIFFFTEFGNEEDPGHE
jgi:integral membrane sensor domain MASE1